MDTGWPVISIGNLTLGGTGKTPMVQHAASVLMDAGHRPAIVLRGYGARRGEDSDEAMEHRAALPGVPVMAQPDRVAALATLRRTHPEVDVVLLDDGFQHRFVKRCSDIVLIDARRVLDEERVLPAGRLREPLASLARATDVVVTHADQVDQELSERITCWHGREPIAWTRHAWSGLTVYRDAVARSESIEHLQGLTLVTRLGVAHPEGVLDMARACGARVGVNMRARDHARVSASELRAMASAACDAILVTAKDWVKLAPLVDWSRLAVPVIVPTLAIEFVAGREAFEKRVCDAAATSREAQSR